jgi:anthranilate phosphoribosyltransferase
MLSCFHFLDLAYFMSDIKRLIKHLGSDLTAQSSLSAVISPADMRSIFAAVIDGGASDIELGALIAMCASIESHRSAEMFSEILLGLSEAINERLMPIGCEQYAYANVVIPNYGDEIFGNAIPLIAIKLQRMGIRVLVHGALETPSGLANCGVFRELGVLPVTTRGQAERRLAEDGLALVPTSLISPGLAAMMALKARLGVSTPAHVLADMLMPVLMSASGEPRHVLHVLNIPAWLAALADTEGVVLQTPVLLSHPVEGSGCKFGSLDSRPQLKYRAGVDSQIETSARDADGVDGIEESGWQTLFQEEMESSADVVSLSARNMLKTSHTRWAAHPVPTDTRGLAAWTRQRLDANVALPQPVVNQLACCLYGAGYAEDFNQAKAMAAVETGSLAA